MRKHFVQFFSPGTFFAETTTKPIASWDTAEAAKMFRYDAKPYGFQFFTAIVADPVDDGEGGKLTVEPKEVERSGMYYITGKLILFDDVPADQSILLSNMRGNRWPIVIETNNSWRYVGTFNADSVIVDAGGAIIRRGSDRDLCEYRQRKIAEWEAAVA